MSRRCRLDVSLETLAESNQLLELAKDAVSFWALGCLLDGLHVQIGCCDGMFEGLFARGQSQAALMLLGIPSESNRSSQARGHDAETYQSPGLHGGSCSTT
jgi:hypothetical protein